MRALAILAVLTAPAFAQSPGGCMERDRIEIADLGEGMAVVTYYNSSEFCSGGFEGTLTSPAGISADVSIRVNASPDGMAERIEVTPLDPGFFASPPVEDVPDGRQVEILIMGGLS